MTCYMHIKKQGFYNIVNNAKSIEIRRKSKFTDSLKNSECITFKYNNITCSKKIIKITDINNIREYLEKIDIVKTGYNTIYEYITRLQHCYKHINNKQFVAFLF